MLFLIFFILQIHLYQAFEYPKDGNVYYLDSSNFNNFFTSQKFQIIILKYFKLGCLSCRKFYPVFKEIAKEFAKDGENGIAFAEVDIMDPENTKLKKYLFIDSNTQTIFPTIKMYFGSLEQEVIYNEKEKSKENLLKWIKQEIELQKHIAKQEL